MSVINKLLGEGLQEVGEKVAKEAGESALAKIAKKIPVSKADDIAQDIAVKSPEMVKVYRGMSAKTDDELKKYVSDMLDPTIQPRTYSGLNVSGEGYNFTTKPEGAHRYATYVPQKESRVVLTTEVPKNRFIQQNAQNENRLEDFIRRAESRGIPYEGGLSKEAAKKDMQAYFKKNGLLGIRSHTGDIYVINQNDPEWAENLAIDQAMRGRGPNITQDAALKNDLQSLLGASNMQNDLDNASRFLGQPMYHSTNTTFDKFDDTFLGSNTGYDNTAFGHFITPDKEFSQKFGDNTMQIDANIKKYITHPYNADYKYSGDELDKIVSDYLTATDNAEGLQALRDMAAEDGSSLYNAYRQDTLINNPFDFAADEKKLLQDKGYDAVEFVEGIRNDLLDNAKGDISPVSSYAVFDGDNLKIKKMLDDSGASKYLTDNFDKSVIVDKKGNLLDLYHGTDENFDKFGDIKTEPGYWFTEDKDYAQSHGKNLMTVNLDMKNPIDMTTTEGEDLLYDLARERFGMKGFVPEDKIFSKDFREFLQDRGYDGLIWDKDGKNTYVAFRPEQIRIRNKNLDNTLGQRLSDADIADPMFDALKENRNDLLQSATKNDLELFKKARAGETISADEIAGSQFIKKLNDDATAAQQKYGTLMTKAMEDNPNDIPPELMQRMNGYAQQVMDNFHANPNIKYDRKAVIFMGGPSSGKSTAGMKMYDAAKGGDFAVLDSDDIKPMFEEFGRGEGANIVHLPSAYTAKSIVLPQAANEGMNLALPIVGKSSNALDYHLNLLNNAGYDVTVVKVDLPVDKAATRNYTRALETNRNVSDHYVRNEVGDKPSKVFRDFVDGVKSGKDKRVTGYARINNDVPFGNTPIVEEIAANDTLARLIQKFGLGK